jgi:hypothetical protein
MEPTCMHGLGLGHLIVDIALIGATLSAYPIYYLKCKFFNKK